jgi:tetratricopeptide (TPR) repeat protein
MWTGLLDDNAFADFTSQPQPAIRNDWFNKLWIPITYDRSFNNFCIDLAPTDYGSEGQIITLWHDSPEREIVAMSFDSFLTAFAQDLQDGIYTYSPIEHGVFRADGSRATESDCPVSKLSYLQQEALIARAKEYMNNSDWMEAIYCFELAFARGVVCFREEEKCAHALDLNNCAWSHAQLSRFEEALPLINMSVKYGEKLVPRQKAYIYGTRGFIHLNLKRYAHAIADFSEALRLKPDHGFAYWYRGEAYERSGKQDRALADKEQALKASFAPPV